MKKNWLGTYIARACYLSFLLIALMSTVNGQQGLPDNQHLVFLTGAGLYNTANCALTCPAGTATDRQAPFIQNIVTLKVLEETPYYIPANFTASMTLTIDYGDNASSYNTVTRTFTVDYNKDPRAKYNAKNYFHFTGAKYVKVTVSNFTSATVGSTSTQSLLQVENEMRVIRYYDLKDQAIASSFTASLNSTNDDELQVNWSWPANTGNNYTQLEWAWLDDDMEDNYKVSGTVNPALLFRNNATRIDLPLDVTSYNIPLLYGNAGKLYCRIRAINFIKNNRSEGPWSAPLVQSFPGHNNALNWQATIDYAEEGKRKVVVQYFDGGQRPRQMVTKDNVNGNVTAVETLYDHQGRPAVQILPAPGISNVIAYTKNLNLFNNQAANTDHTDFFDLQPAGNNSSTTESLSTNQGAAKYYSPANPDKNTGANRTIPDAEGYAYSVTRYMPDRTGRIMAQSGVGPTFQMGKGHETKYYYGNASQEELDGLFGTEAGIFTHYSKNMVKDGNGAMSVSYMDMHGRTIATALAGDAPSSLVPLDLNATHYPNQAGSSIIRNLLNSSTNVVKNNSLEAINTILVPATTNYNFRYELNPQALTLAACPEGSNTTVCYDCMYDLEIVITDESGEQAPVIKKFSNIKLDADDVCSTAVGAFRDSSDLNKPLSNLITFTQQLAPGSYAVRKTLTMSEASLQLQKEAYLQKGLCKTEQQLIDSVYSALITITGCDQPVVPEPCTNCAVSQALPGLREMMIADMMPYGGQYAKDPSTIVMTNGSYNKYDVFATQLGGNHPYYKRPLNESLATSPYLDDLGQTDAINTSLSSTSAADFATAFKYKWAESLLPYHPEFAKLKYAETQLATSYNWINTFTQTNTFSEAETNGYILYSGNTTATPYNDPFYVKAPGSQPDMVNMVKTSYLNREGIVVTMWQVAYGEVRCKNLATVDQQKSCYTGAPVQPTASIYNTLTTEEKDQVWQAFRNLYTNERNRQVIKFINTQVALGDAGTLVDDKYILHFPTEEQLAVQYNTNGDFNFWPTTPGGPPNVPANQGTAPITAQYNSRCDSYINSWKAALLQCPTLAGRSDKETILTDIVNGMTAVCKKGADGANPYGSSNVAPSTPVDGSPRSFEEVIYAVFTAKGIAVDNLCNPYVIEFPKPYGKTPKFTYDVISALDSCNCTRFTQLKAAAQTAGYTPTNFTSLNAYFKATYKDTITLALFNAFSQCSQLGMQTACWYKDTVIYYNCNEEPPCGGVALRTSGQSITAKQTAASGITYKNTADTSTRATSQLLVPVCPEGYHWDYGLGACVADGPTPLCSVICSVQKCATVAKYNIPLSSPQPYPDFLKCGGTSTRCITCTEISSYTAEFKTKFSSPHNNAPVMNTSLTTEQIASNVLYQKFLNYRTGFQYTWLDYAHAADAAGCNLATYATNTGTQTVLCADTLALTDTTGFLQKDPPCQKTYNMAVSLAQSLYEYRKLTLLADFEAQYRAKCLSAKDSFTVTYTNKEYHYTLYYYDMAGNLVKTVAPKGVRPDFSKTWTDKVVNARNNGTVERREHLMANEYRYNSLNSLVAQKTPDAGTTAFWYDKLGRIVISQNAEQALNNKYNYTLYDELGRIREVGQKLSPAASMTQIISQNEASLNSWINTTGGNREQITYTVYTTAYVFENDTYLTQRNLRNKISYTGTKKISTDQSHYSASYYTYDLHGNIDTLLQDFTGIPEMGALSRQRFKKIAYDYDLVGGQVNMVTYQPGEPDAFYHKYQYDAENKMVGVYTSRDSVVWEKDAAYDYHKHSPLARTVLGQQQVQGIDHVYNLQGWIKGINTTNIGSEGFDVGKDGVAGSSNSNVAKDVLGYALHYYDAIEGGNTWLDYKPIAGSSPFARPGASAGFVSLYNGNIGGVSNNIAGFAKGGAATTNAVPLFNKYRYDALNRIVSMQVYKGLDIGGNVWSPVAINDYKEAVTYDPNGNILSYNRKGTPSAGQPLEMDALAYYYKPGTNQVDYVFDTISSGNYGQDIDAQSAGNYEYDAVGNLVKDNASGLYEAGGARGIKWTAYGKIESVTTPNGIVYYSYDVAGNRISKSINGKVTVYVRNSTGTVLSVYEKTASTALVQQELYIYGASRVGIVTPLTVNREMVNLNGLTKPATLSSFTRGEKVFELSNHLGNVLTTLSDKKIQHSSNDLTWDYYEADVLTATDYYPFGMLMPGRAIETAGCYEEVQNAMELKASSDFESGVTQNGTKFIQNGVTWQPQASAVLSLQGTALKITNSGLSASDGALGLVPLAQVESFTTYIMECDILEQSPDITGYYIQVLSQTGDLYRVSTIQNGLGHHSVVFTTNATFGTYVAFRITSIPATAGSSFVIDNFTMKKYTAVNPIQEYGTDFNTAVKSGVNIDDNGRIWKPLNNTINTLSVIGTTDRKIQVNCTAVDNSRISSDFTATGGKNYLLKFTTTQAQADKRLILQIWSRTGTGSWTVTESRGVIFTGSGNYQFNFTVPAGADQIRIEFLRNNTGNPVDGLDVPYTIDDFSLVRLETYTTKKVSVCPPPYNAGQDIYRYGFNGKENDNEIKGKGNQQDYGLRIYDPRLGKFLSTDPLFKGYPWYTPYQFAGNRPINSIDLDGAEEFESYQEYKKHFGDKAMSESAWNGSDGAWLTSDREEKNGKWSTAMNAITQNKWHDRFKYYGSVPNNEYPFKMTRDYYLWCQNKVDSKGWMSRWAMGASYLVDELADTYQFEGKGFSVASGVMMSSTTEMGKGILTDLNLGIANLAVDQFNSILFGAGMNFPNTEKGWYDWDKKFIEMEQKDHNSPGYNVYSKYNGTEQLKNFNKLSRQEGVYRFGVSKHFFPSFKLFNGDLTNKETQWDVELRVNLPLLMLYPVTHPFYDKNQRFQRGNNPIGIGHAEAAASAVDQWHQKQMKY